MTSMRLLGTLLVLGGGLMGFQASQPSTLWHGPGGIAASSADSILVQPPDRLQRLTTQRIQAKSQLVEQLRQQEKTLFEVAALFQLLDEEFHGPGSGGWKSQPGNCDNEKLCRQVIQWTISQLRSEEAESEAMALQHQLEEELADHLARNGKVILPTW